MTAVPEQVGGTRSFLPSVEGMRAWEELGWVGREIAIGPARLQVINRIGRCAATNVDPATAERDMNLPNTLQRAFGHADMGVYAKVIGSGLVWVKNKTGVKLYAVSSSDRPLHLHVRHDAPDASKIPKSTAGDMHIGQK